MVVRWARRIVEVFVMATVGMTALALAGCATSPDAAQGSRTQVQPAAELSGALKDIHAQMVSLKQQNQQLTETVTNMVQETGSLRARVEEVRGDLNQVTQSFRPRPGAEKGAAGQPDRGRPVPADRVQPGSGAAHAPPVVGDSAPGPLGDCGPARGADRDGKTGVPWRVKLMWYCICLVVGFVAGVVTAVIVAAKNREKAGKVIERVGAIERAVEGKGGDGQ
jgi:hypothetical protein